MKIAVIGGGGREHAIIKKIKQNKNVKKIYALPGNGGILADAECVPIGAKELDKIVEFVRDNSVDFVIVAPDDPLVLGLVDELHKIGVKCFGPEKAAAEIEGSKAFSKQLMKKYNIPTAEYCIFDNFEKAVEYVKTQQMPIVIKADGLALGKGVVIADTIDEAVEALSSIMNDKIFGSSGNVVVIEEYLTGPEVSVLCFTDGKTIVPMVSSMDHKRALDGDKGLNTGGMGTIAPNPYYTNDISERCMCEIFLPTVNAMKSEGRAFKGCLYFGLMITDKGPKVIEYNCRFGDPETQVVLPLLESDLLDIMLAVEEGRLGSVEIKLSDMSACCVIMASNGYPQKYETGFEIEIGDIGGEVFVAGAKSLNGKLLTSGGRVLGITALAPSLSKAIDLAYCDVAKIHFNNSYFRHDIGQKALKNL